MRRIEKVSIIVHEDVTGKPYVLIHGLESDDQYGAVEMKLWAEEIEITDYRRK